MQLAPSNCDALASLRLLDPEKLFTGLRAIPSVAWSTRADFSFNHGTGVVFPARRIPENRREDQDSTQESDCVVHRITTDRPGRWQYENNGREKCPYHCVRIHPPAESSHMPRTRFEPPE